jgi:hypothetical protein
MKYFGTKQTAEIDADAIAVERLMAIASRFKPADSSDVIVEQPSADSEEAPPALELPN